MTVQEIIYELSLLDPETVVLVNDSEGRNYGAVYKVEVRDGLVYIE